MVDVWLLCNPHSCTLAHHTQLRLCTYIRFGTTTTTNFSVEVIVVGRLFFFNLLFKFATMSHAFQNKSERMCVRMCVYVCAVCARLRVCDGSDMLSKFTFCSLRTYERKKEEEEEGKNVFFRSCVGYLLRRSVTDIGISCHSIHIYLPNFFSAFFRATVLRKRC